MNNITRIAVVGASSDSEGTLRHAVSLITSSIKIMEVPFSNTDDLIIIDSLSTMHSEYDEAVQKALNAFSGSSSTEAIEFLNKEPVSDPPKKKKNRMSRMEKLYKYGGKR